MRDNVSTQPTDPGQARRPGFVRADRALITATLNALRASPRRLCFFCGRPLDAGICAECDR